MGTTKVPVKKVSLSSESDSERDSSYYSSSDKDKDKDSNKEKNNNDGDRPEEQLERSPKSMDVDDDGAKPSKVSDGPPAEAPRIKLVEAPSSSTSRGIKCPICYTWVKLRANLARHQRESARCRKYQGIPFEQSLCRCGKAFPGQWAFGAGGGIPVQQKIASGLQPLQRGRGSMLQIQVSVAAQAPWILSFGSFGDSFSG